MPSSRIENFGGSLRERESEYVPHLIRKSIGSAARTKTHGKNKAAARRMRILHAVLFETAR